MIKETKTKTGVKVYNTETAAVVKKVTCGNYGDPAGYEMTMYQSPEGEYFLYTYGGEASAYAKEKITTYTKANALKWIEEN